MRARWVKRFARGGGDDSGDFSDDGDDGWEVSVERSERVVVALGRLLEAPGLLITLARLVAAALLLAHALSSC